MKSSRDLLAAVCRDADLRNCPWLGIRHLKLPIKDAMENAAAKEKLGTDVKFFLVPRLRAKVQRAFGIYSRTRRPISPTNRQGRLRVGIPLGHDSR